MRTTILCDENNKFTRVENPDDISELIADPHRLVWLDLDEPTADDFRLLRAEFALHPLAIEDAMARHQRPKVDQYQDFYFVVFYSVAQPAAPRRCLDTPGRGPEGVQYLSLQRYHAPPPPRPPMCCGPAPPALAGAQRRGRSD